MTMPTQPTCSKVIWRVKASPSSICRACLNSPHRLFPAHGVAERREQHRQHQRLLARALLCRGRAWRFARPSRGDVVLLQGNLALETTGAILAALGPGRLDDLQPGALLAGSRSLVGSLQPRHRQPRRSGGAGLISCAARAAIVTLGAAGCTLIEGGRTGKPFPRRTIVAIDTTGCGDAFCGAMVALLVGHGERRRNPTRPEGCCPHRNARGRFRRLPSRDGTRRHPGRFPECDSAG